MSISIASLRNPRDFFVEEIPLYEPAGKGDHCLLWIEKSGLSTPEAVRRLARALGRREAEFGWAGLKDAAATTRQVISCKGLGPNEVRGLELTGLKVLRAELHTRAVRTGHLKGNRFRICLGELDPSRLQPLRVELCRLATEGLPNAYGVQRFGSSGSTPVLGKALIEKDWDKLVSTLLGQEGIDDSPRTREAREAARRGDYERASAAFPPSLIPERAAGRALARGAEPEQAVRAIPRKFRQIYISALQSKLFNQVLKRRLPELNRPFPGDLAWLHRNGACFIVEDPAAEAARVDSFEISISGPIFGYKMKWPEGRSREMEEEVLSDERLAIDDFRVGGGLSQKGARRPLRVPLEGAAITEEEGKAILRFELPKGAYATTLLEAIKVQ